MMKKWMNVIADFCKCGFAGWCLEVLFTSTESMMAGDWRLIGKTSLLMFPIYGMGIILRPIARATDWWVDEITGIKMNKMDKFLRHGFLYTILIFIGEYVSGTWLRSKGICPWDYTGRHSSINGLIRLDFAPLWFITGLIFESITNKKG